jgi:hypothetical protein
MSEEIAINGAKGKKKDEIDTSPDEDVLDQSKAYTWEEYKIILDYVKSHKTKAKWYDILAFKFLTGCRTGEAIGMMWCDVSFDRERILIRRTYNNLTKSFYPLKNHKNGSLIRMFPMPKNGELWVHDNYNGYCNFYGVQATPDITTVFNQSLIQKKTWISISEVANSIWSCPVIYTNVNSYGTQRQQTNLIEADFAVLEGNQHASLLKDVNSIGGIVNGDSMKGNWVAVKFQGLNPNNFVFLSEISMKYIISNLTNR